MKGEKIKARVCLNRIQFLDDVFSDSVLILSSQGSIGVAAVDLCANLFKCKVG